MAPARRRHSVGGGGGGAPISYDRRRWCQQNGGGGGAQLYPADMTFRGVHPMGGGRNEARCFIDI